jgi:hypothetical protein
MSIRRMREGDVVIDARMTATYEVCDFDSMEGKVRGRRVNGMGPKDSHLQG